jgi:hypothetical protein
MDDSESGAIPLLLHYAQPVTAAPVAYSYDPELEVNVLVGPDGSVRPAVEGPDAAILTKTQTVVEGEDQRANP